MKQEGERLVGEVLSDIRKSFPQIDVEMDLSPKEGLAELIKRSGLEDTPASKTKFWKLAGSVKWLGTGAEMSYLISTSQSDLKPDRPVVLGLGDFRDGVNTFMDMTGGEHWHTAYLDYRVDMNDLDHTLKFMKKLTGSGRDILFLVPSFLYQGRSFNTVREIDWLMRHPDKAKNVYLVFGAYEMINPNWYATKDAARMDYLPRRRLVAEKLLEWPKLIG